MADELDLTIKATADATQAKAELTELAAAEQKVAEATTQAATASAEMAGALDEATAAQLRADAIAKEQSLALDRVAEAYIEARTAIAAMADTAEAGGKTYQAAIAAAAAATAELEIAIEAVRARGGPISPAMIANLASYDAAVAAATIQTEKHASAQKISGAEAAIFRDNASGAARAVASLGGEVGTAVLGLGALLIAFDLVPMLLDKIDSKSRSWAQSLVDAALGLHEEDTAIRGANESLEHYEERVDKAAEKNVQFRAAAAAIGAGLIAQETDVDRAIVAWEAYRTAQTGSFDQFPAFVKSLKDMGVTFKATHDEMAREANLFGQAYKAVITRDGIGSANAWADANKQVLNKIVSYYQESGQKVPGELEKIVKAIGLVTKAEEDAAKSKKLREKFDADFLKIVDLAREYDKLRDTVVDDVEKMRAARDRDIASVDARTDKTVADIHKEEDTLRSQWINNTIGQDQYRQNMDKLIAAEQETRRNATDEKKKLNDSEKQSEDQKVKDFATSSAKLIEQLNKNGETVESAAAKLAIYQHSQEATVKAQQDEIANLLAAKAPHEDLNKIVKDGATQYKAVHSAIGGVVKQTNAYAKSAAGVAKAHAAIAKSSPFKKRGG
jgi:hypothetical protein